MNILTLAYVRSTDVLSKESELWNAYINSDPDHSWGDNEHSLIKVGDLLKELEEVVEEVIEDHYDGSSEDIDNWTFADAWRDNTTIQALKKLDPNLLVDLES